MMKDFRQLTAALKSLVPKTEATRLFLERTQKQPQELRQQALNATKANLAGARSSLEAGKVNVTAAREFFEDAVKIADVVYGNEKFQPELNGEEKRVLSEAYGGYAEFLRWTETADHYDRVNELVNIALKLNPDNLEAKAAGEDIKFSFKHD
jgi:hypothetical protein